MKVAIPVALVIIVLAGFIVFKVYNKPHHSVEEENSLSISAVELFAQFEANETEASKLFLNKVVEVTGEVSEVSKNQDGMQVVVLKTKNDFYGVSCTMEIEQPIQKGSTVTIKGFCIGYLSDVVVNNCKTVKQ